MPNTLSNVTDTPSHIIAIGASAGGLEALELLFDALPDNLGCTYVIIQHLSPDFKSMLGEILKKHTNMPTFQALDGEKLLSNTVYMIPAGKRMRIIEGKINLSATATGDQVDMPINELFRTLAQDAKNKAVGIILSGTGSDGSRGIQAMKEAGAMIIAQDTEEAQFTNMPQCAINTGAVDFVLKVASMPQCITNFISHPLSKTTDKFKLHLSQNTGLLEQVLQWIYQKTNLDFKAYKESTVSRRIEHRMSINNKLSLQEYWEYLQSDETEIELVKQDLLIGVTQFFRDRALWDRFREDVVKPLIHAGNPEEPIRIWCTGCSTGEEAYSIAMLFDSTINELGLDRTIKIFASDIDQNAVAYASRGIYPSGICNEIPSNLINEYFTTIEDGNFKVTKKLRGLVVLATHNLIQDPPFSNMDLVSCRNTLIYLQHAAQQKVLASFHFSLKPKGYMLLGNAESPGDFSNYFHTVDTKLRIYQKIQDLRIPVSSIKAQGIRTAAYEPKNTPQIVDRRSKRPTKQRHLSIGFSALQERFFPPTFILDNKFKLVYTYGDTSRFTTKLSPGEVTNDIADLLVPELVNSVLAAALSVTRDDNVILMKNVLTESDAANGYVTYNLNCFSFIENDDANKYIALSLLRDTGLENSTADRIYTPDEQTQQRLTDLDSSLIKCQRMYREALEEIDSSSDELQTINEELMAANEELQSTNEEWQSLNEELYTVNVEYQQNITDLTDANNDLENLTSATGLAVLFLDEKLRIRRYTQPLTRYLNIMDFDLNRPFMDLSLKFEFNGLHELIESVNDTGESINKMLEISDKPPIEISISPYIKGKNNNGVIVSMRRLETADNTVAMD